MQQTVSRFIAQYRSKVQNNLLLNRLSSVLAIDMLVKLSGFLLIPVYLRLMTQSEFGMYNYILSILATFSLVLNFGLYIPLAKMYHDPLDRNEKGRMLYTIAVSLMLLMLTVILPLYLFEADYWVVRFLFKNQFDYGRYRLIILMSLCATILSFMLTNFFFSSEKIQAVKKYNLFRIVLVNIAVLAGLYFFPGDMVRTRLAITYTVEAVLLLSFIHFFLKELVPRFDRKLALKALSMGWPIMSSAILGIVINFSDKFFLEKYGGFSDLSYYYLAVSFAGILTIITGSIQNAWLPLFMKEKDLQRNVAKTSKMAKQLSLILTLLALAIYVMFFGLLSIGIIPLKYREVLYILPILLLTQIFSSLTPFLGNYLVYFQKTYLVSLSGVIVCVISLAISFYLVPVWGVYGAATAALVSNLSYMLIYFGLVRRIVRQRINIQYSK